MTYHEGDLDLIKKDMENALKAVQPKVEPVEVPEFDEAQVGEEDQLT
jgi:hypothetical protein